MPFDDPRAWLAGLSFFVILPLIILIIAWEVFWIVELIDAARREFPDPNTKILWILVILFTQTIGAIIYYFVGKPQGTLPGQYPRLTGVRP